MTLKSSLDMSSLDLVGSGELWGNVIGQKKCFTVEHWGNLGLFAWFPMVSISLSGLIISTQTQGRKINSSLTQSILTTVNSISGKPSSNFWFQLPCAMYQSIFCYYNEIPEYVVKKRLSKPQSCKSKSMTSSQLCIWSTCWRIPKTTEQASSQWQGRCMCI